MTTGKRQRVGLRKRGDGGERAGSGRGQNAEWEHTSTGETDAHAGGRAGRTKLL